MPRGPWIIPGKLEAPAPADLLPRELWPAGPLPPALVLAAGPGYGKTLALWLLARRAARDGAPIVWLSLDEHDADPATLFHYVVAGVRLHVPQFGNDVMALLSAERLEWHGLWQAFFRELADFNLAGLVIALDDCHHLMAGDGFKTLAYFLDKLPAGIQLFLTSRKRPPATLTARGRVALLDHGHLRFSPEEATTFLRARAPGGEVPAAWTHKLAELDGWPLGLELVARRTGGAADWDAAAGEERLAEYLAAEFYESQPAERRPFMLAIAILPELTPAACRQIFDAPDAARWLDALVEDGLAWRLAGGSYRLPAYLRAFLAAEAARVLPEALQADWHRRAAEHYRSVERHELALGHLVAARAWPEALAACGRAFPAMIYGGRAAQVERWLAAVPPAVAAAEPLLPLWRGHTLARAGNTRAAARAYEEAIEGFTARHDPRGAFKALVRLAPIQLRAGNTREAGRLLLQAQASQAAADAEDRVDFQLARALAAEQRGDEAMVRECNELALEVPVDGNIEIAASHCIAHLNLFTFALHEGDLGLAGSHVDDAVAIARAWEFHPYHLVASFLQASLRLVTGDLAGAGALLRAVPANWHDVLDWHDRACAFTVLGHFYQLFGAWKEAEDALARSMRCFEQAGYVEGKKVPSERLLWLALQRRQYERVEAILAGAGDRELGSVHDLALAVPAARARHLAGNPAGALAELHSAIPELERLGARLLYARARLFEAAARLALGDRRAAAEALADARATCERHGYDFLLTQDQALWQELAALDGESPPSPADDRLELRCFGPMEVRRGGLVLDQWPRRKAKFVLAALAFHPRGLRMAELVELVWRDEPRGGSQTVLKVAISALRRALEPGLANGERSRFVRLEDDRYMLAPEALAYVDVRAFDAGLARARGLHAADPVEAADAYEEALAHVRGALLEDDFFASFFEAERERLRRQALAALFWLADHHRGRGEAARVERVLDRAIALAPCDEEAYALLVKHYQHVGRPERARQVYWDCRKAFKQHLGTTPSPELEELLGGSGAPISSAASPEARSPRA